MNAALYVMLNFALFVQKLKSTYEFAACVNCVRWSNSGRFLASAGDDKLVMIWQSSKYVPQIFLLHRGRNQLT